MVALVHDGRLGPEKAAAFQSSVDKVPSEVRGEFYDGRISLPEDLEKTVRDLENLPARTAIAWDEFLSRASTAMSDLARSVRHLTGTSPERQTASR
jgi:hypothetical protein